MVGVSRQAVSKWEADRAIPDVNNCIAMSRVFGISLAELLELEEPEKQGLTAADHGKKVLTSSEACLEEEKAVTQKELDSKYLQLVDQIVEKYTTAQKKLRRRWRWPIILVGCVLAVGIAWLWQWLTDMNRIIDYLHGEVAGLQGELIAEIAGISEQVQAGLREENSLVTDYEIQVVQADLKNDTITYEVSVNLKEGHVNTKQKVMARYGDISGHRRGWIWKGAQPASGRMDAGGAVRYLCGWLDLLGQF